MIRTLLRLLPDNDRGTVRRYLLLTVLGVVIRAVGAVLLVPLVGTLFDPTPGRAWLWLGVLAAVTVVGWLVDAAGIRLGHRLGFTLLDRAQHQVADRLTRVRLTWFTAENTRTARSAVAATGPDLVGLFAYLFTPLVVAFLFPVALGLALLPVSWPVGLAALLGVPVLLGAFAGTVRITRRADRAAAESNAELTERILEFARTQQALRAARRVEPARSQVGSALAAQHGATMRLLGLQGPGRLLFGLASQLALVLLAGTITVLVVRGSLGAPEAIALVVVVARYLESFTALGDLSGAIESIGGTLRHLQAVLTAPTPDRPTAVVSSGPPTLTLRDVSFSYSDDGPPVLDRVDLVLAAGTTTAVVGPSGSGKSTLVGLLAGLHRPSAGEITADDAPVGPHGASVVFQHPYLFDGTIAENVRVGDPTAGPQRQRDAMALARVDEIVDRLPAGDSTRVGEAGTALSGGERQRVSIARALLNPAPVLLIDEATSALDAENGAAIVAALSRDPIPRTRVVVAHSLSAISTADRVLFVERGRIVEDGTVSELLTAGGRFASFWQQQRDGAGWRIGAR